MSFKSGVIKGSKMLLVSKYYSTRDLDLLVSLGILPDLIDHFSGKASLSAKCVAKFVVESKFLRRTFRRFRWSLF